MKVIDGDITEIKRGVIGHQVNCQLVMGAGLAKQIRDKWPHVFVEYKRMSVVKPENRLGMCQMVQADNEIFVANLFGQFNYIPRGTTHTDYNALASAMQALNKWNQQAKLQIFLPIGIGCGLAGGNWPTVEGIISTTLPTAIMVRKS